MLGKNRLYNKSKTDSKFHCSMNVCIRIFKKNAHYEKKIASTPNRVKTQYRLSHLQIPLNYTKEERLNNLMNEKLNWFDGIMYI